MAYGEYIVSILSVIVYSFPPVYIGAYEEQEWNKIL